MAIAFGKTGLPQVLAKVKKGFLKKKKAAAAGKDKEKEEKKKEEAKEEEKKAGDVEKEGEKEEAKEGPLKGKLVRVVEETSPFVGRVLEVLGHAKGKLHAQVAWKDAQEQFFEKTKVPAKVAIPESIVLPVEEIPKPELTPWKSLRFKDEERAEAEELFPPAELEHGYKLAKERSLPLLHMEM